MSSDRRPGANRYNNRNRPQTAGTSFPPRAVHPSDSAELPRTVPVTISRFTPGNMAAETPLPSTSHALAAPANNTLSLDPAVVVLLEQQAEISAKLAILLPQTYGFDTKAELSNLRHKLRVLQTFTSDRRLPKVTPVFSEAEEARHLEYRIECIETVCLDHGHDLGDPRVVDTLNTIHAQDAPPGFGAWLRKNLAAYDLAPRAWKQNNALMAQSGKMGHGNYLHQRSLPQYRSFKCPDEGCIHYIYGFLHQTELDDHCRLHTAHLKRGSALSLSDNTPLSPLSGHHRRQPTNTNGHSSSSPTPALGDPSPFLSSLQLPPLVKSVHKREHDLLRSYSLGSERQPSTSTEEEPDELLPPLKRSRNAPRLESISELGLLQGTDMCLYCKYSREKCDPNSPCHSCNKNAISMETGFWSTIGCHRGPLADLARSLVPDFLGSGRAESPLASPRTQSRDINDFLERTYWFEPEHVRVVQTNLDFEDGWWTHNSGTFPPADLSQPPLETEPNEQPPPALKVLASSQNMRGNVYNFWQLLKLSGLLSASRGAEALSFPVLYHAKLFLRELLFFDLQRDQPAVTVCPKRGIVSGAYENVTRHGVVRSCAAQFLQSFDRVIQREESIDPRTWLATFFSLCIFSIIRTILVDMVSQKQAADQGSHLAPIHALYKATAAIFSGWLPPFFDDLRVVMGDEDRELYSTASMIIKRNIWSERGISSTEDFLLHLGDRKKGGLWYGFMRERASMETDLPPGATMRGGEQQLLPAKNATSNLDTRTPLNAGEVWSHTEIRAQDEAASVAPANNGISADLCKPSMDNGIEDPTHLRRRDKPPTPPQPPRTQSFHLANMAKNYICVEPTSLDISDLMPELPLSECGPCMSKKRYISFDDAVAHLRQEHYNTGKRITSNSKEWPPLSVLGRWTREIRMSSSMQDDHPPGSEESPGRMACAPIFAQERSLLPHCLPQPTSPPLHEQRLSPSNLASDRSSGVAHPQPSTLLPLQNPPRRQHFPPFSVSPPSVRAAASMHMNSTLASPRMHVSPMPNPPVQAHQNIQPSMPSNETAELIVTALNTDHYAHVSTHRKGSAALQPTSGVGVSNGNAKPEETRHGHRNRCPYPECGRVFKDLPAHMLTHMEERPEKCPIETCEYHTKGFARKYDKNRHALTHYKGTMVCPFCHRIGSDYEKAFNRADVFKRHLTAVHNVEQTPPNSRKSMSVSGINRQGLLAGESSEQDAAARCSICRSQFVSAQDFYEHLDDCVLNVIIPPAPKDAGEADIRGAHTGGESLVAKTVRGAIKSSQALNTVATKMVARSGSGSKIPPIADSISTMGGSHIAQVQRLQSNQMDLSEKPLQKPQRASPRKSPRNSLPKTTAGGIGNDRGHWHNGCDGVYDFHQGQQQQGLEGQEPGTRPSRPELGVLKQGFTMPP